MSQSVLFIVGMGISLAIGGVAVLVLNHPLKKLLETSSDTAEGINFWSRYVAILWVLSPLLVYILFGTPTDMPTDGIFVEFLKYSFGSALSGLFLALAATGIQIKQSRTDHASKT